MAAKESSQNRIKTTSDNFLKFPYPDSVDRIRDYEYFEKLFLGQHMHAFGYRVDDERYNKEYSALRYVMANFAGLVSKVMADLLFTEPPKITVPDGDQEWLEAFIHDNDLDVQNYESALSNSFFGDALYKLRIGKRQASDKKPTVIVEDTTPIIYFPMLDNFNARQKPEEQELAWKFKFGDKEYLRKEIHITGKIINRVFLLESGKITAEVSLDAVGLGHLKEIEETQIERSLITHVPNWKYGRRFFGISDYNDLTSLFYAINNRLTKVDNILDKHSDPILLVPSGILDEDGQVNKKHIGVLEVQEGENNKPEYVVWDASLENAFKEIEKLVEMLFMTSEISPHSFGMGEGGVESGRALKLKLLRTIAKARRKRTYYDRALKEMIFTAQVLAKAWNVGVGPKNIKLKKDPQIPEIEWQDGLPIDEQEQLENEEKALGMGITTEEEAMMRVYGVDEKTAEETAQKIRDAKRVAVPVPNFGSNPPGDNKEDNEDE